MNEAVSMEHAREIDLIELVAQRLAAEREKAVRAHLDDCPACRAKVQDMRKTWDLLGAWQVGLPEAIAHIAGAPAPAGQGRAAGWRPLSGETRPRAALRIIRFPGLRTAVRVAAALVVSVLLGYAGGRWSIRPVPLGPGTEPPPYFSVLGFEVGDNFSPLVLQDGPSASQES
jgi:anti-sigma factor RsiW